MQCHKLGRIPNIQDVKSADCNWIKEGNKTVEVYIEINTGQARLVESMLISLREHLFVFFQKMDKQEKLATWNGYQQVHFIREPDSNGIIKLQKQLW